jgi:hypothetical protein
MKPQDYLQYQLDTGKFIWKKSPNRRIKVGTEAGFLQNGYIAIRFFGKTIYAHRLAWLFIYGEYPENEIDHINGIKTDNNIDNLRDVTRETNMRNMNFARTNNLLNILGVSKSGKKFISRIRTNLGRIYLGTFDTAEEAHQSYIKAKEKYNGCA